MSDDSARLPGAVISRRTIKEVRRYMIWDCSSCGNTGFNAHTCLQCPFCGNSKDASDREERSSTEVDANYKYAGANITCTHCGTENKCRFGCIECGAALDEKFKREIVFLSSTADLSWQTRTVQVDETGRLSGATETPWTADAEPEPPSEPAAPTELPRVQPERVIERQLSARKRSFTPMIVISGVVVLLLVVVGYLYIQWSTVASSTVTVSSVSWTYSLDREDYAARKHSRTEEDFSWEPPSQAFAKDANRVKVRDEPIIKDVWITKSCTRKVDASYDGDDGTWVDKTDEETYDCSGWEKKKVGEKPIYANHWTWQQMEWAPASPLTARGNSHVVDFPEFVETSTLRQKGQPTTTFYAVFTYIDDDGDTNSATRSYPREVWVEIEVGKSYNAFVDGFDRLLAVDTLDPRYKELIK